MATHHSSPAMTAFTRHHPAMIHRTTGSLLAVALWMAEVDGNRTRRTGITHPTRFEGGGAHQALGHLHTRNYRRTRNYRQIGSNRPV